MANDDEHDHDLPLMSNSRDILVHHYVLDLTCVFKEKRFKGSITLFCESQIHDVQSEKLVTTIIKEQHDENAHDDSGAASPHTLQNVLDLKSIDKDKSGNVQTETESELSASAVVDSLLFQESTSRLFSVKQLHLYTANDTHISCSPCEMPSFFGKELVVFTARTENKHLSSLVDHCYNSLEETHLHPNSSVEITNDLFLFPNSDPGSKIEFHSCQNSGIHISDCAHGPHELQIGTQTSSKPEVQLYSFKTSPLQTQIFCHDQTEDTSSEVHMLCDGGIETYNKDVELHNITQVCHNMGGNLHVCRKIFQNSDICSSSKTKACYLSGNTSHNSNLEILGKLELAPDKSINSHETIDITDLHIAPISENVKVSCRKHPNFELESTPEINSNHSTDFHLILDSWNILVDYVEEMVVHDSTSPMSQKHDQLLQKHDELVQSCDSVAQECGELAQGSSLIYKGNNVLDLGSDDFVNVNGKLIQNNYNNFVRLKDGLSQAKDETVRRNKEGFVENEKLVKRNDEPIQLTMHEFIRETNDHSKRNDKNILLGNNIIFRESNKHVKEGGKLAGGNDEQVKQDKKREVSLIAVRKRLVHETSKNCIRICKPGVQHAQDFPRIIRIHFTTDPEGSSLKWTQDQDGNECVYTHGHWINNRSLFPSQDVPDAMATWEACIHVEPQYTVLMSGDKEPIVTTSRCGLKSCYYHSEMEMPSSTLALAVGKWQEIRLLSEDQDIRMSDIETTKLDLPCRIFSPSSLQKAAQAVLGRYIPSCMEASASFLGPHPFKRLDILIVPYSFNSLGMASPSLMFLSQSILSADLMMCIRVAHEMSHSWFGLLIGPQDWTEEWLSEGFCTYTQEYIHCHIMKWNKEERLNHFGIRDYLKYRVLKAELHNTDEIFHILRPNKGQEIMLDGSTVQYVKNGMNPVKGYMQVHYLKGYFLLKHLEKLVGVEDFHEFLLKCVQHFHGQLITSKDVLELFFSNFSHLRLQGVSTESITQEWLENPGMPKITCCELQEDNELAQHVLAQVRAFKEFGSEYKSLHWTKRRKKNPEDILSKLDGDQLVLFLEELLKEERVHHLLLSCLRSFYSLHTSNADVLHRWCELVIKHKLQTNYQDVFWFLVNHQAMGVYLFGELIISEDSLQKKLAEACFRKIASDMDTDVRATVHSMLYGT